VGRPGHHRLNPGADLPGVSITVVHRSDGSGTTYIFSDYLSTVSLAGAKTVGAARSGGRAVQAGPPPGTTSVRLLARHAAMARHPPGCLRWACCRGGR
jgi:ABC-type phosphate transport system substrate-binding protein